MIRLALLLPTNKPKVFEEVFLKSVHNLCEAKENIVISINFQMPWTNDKIRQSLEYLQSLGFTVAASLNSYYSANNAEIPFNRIRYDCARQVEYDIDYYGLCDDDFWFGEGSGAMVNKIINKFDSDTTLGLLQCRHKSKFIPFEEFDLDPKVHNYFTDAGLFFRKLDEFIVFPEDSLENVGAGEEHVIGNAIVDKGYNIRLYLQSEIIYKVNYGGLRNFDWLQDEILNSPKGNMTYIKKYRILNSDAKEVV